MDNGAFAEFWQRQGHRVIETESCIWYDAHPLAYLSLPYHRMITPGRRELARVLLGGPAAVVRYPMSPQPGRRAGGLFICVDRSYSLTALDKKARNQTRRGLERCTVTRIEFARLAEQGHALNVETFVRQGRSPNTMDHVEWRRYCETAAQIEGFEAWAAFVDDQLAAFMVTALIEDCFSILHQSSANAYLDKNPNNALVFTVTRQKLACAEVSYVSYGLKSIDETGGLDHFKIQMGFQLRDYTERVVVNPVLRPILALGGRRLIDYLAYRHPANDLWRKAAKALRLASGGLNV